MKNPETAPTGSPVIARWLLLAGGLLASAILAIALHHRSSVAERRHVAAARASAVEKGIEQYVSEVVSAAYATALVARADLDGADLDGAGPDILKRHRGRVASIQLHPGGVAAKIHPLRGNEAVLGLDVVRDPIRGPKARSAIQSRLPTLDGPHERRQGGAPGLAVRVPIFRSDAAGAEQFWGFAVAATTLDALLSESGAAALADQGYSWSLVRDDGRVVATAAGALSDPVVVEAVLPNTSWILSLAPRAGWGASPVDLAAYAALLGFTGLLCALLYRLLRQPEVLRRAVEERTRALDLAYREREAILNGIPDPAWMKDRDGRWLSVNAALGKLAGLDAAELVGRRHRDVFPQGAAEVEENDREVLAGARPVYAEEFVGGADGVLRCFEVVKHPYRDGSGALVGHVGIARDVTARRSAERALRESEERFRQLVENTNQLFWVADAEASRLLYTSPAFPQVWGVPPGDAPDRAALGSRVHPDDRDAFAAAFADALRGGGADVQYRVVWPDRAVRWVHERTFAIRDDAGRVYRVGGIAEDVSDRRAIESRLLQSQKMEAVGHLAGGVAHDFNNLLCVISASADLLREEVDPSLPLATDVQEIRDAATRAKRLIQQLLAFSRHQVLQPRVLRLADVAGETSNMLRRLIGENIDLQLRFDDGLWNVRADPGQLEQVIVNLVVNARDAMPAGGTITIQAQNVWVDGRLAAGHDGASPGPHVVLEVRDTGCGIAPETCARVFEPFFSTKQDGKGTGLGLSTVYGIVKQSGGFIQVESELGRGASFRIFLPRCEDPDERRAEPARHVAEARCAGRILLVEDEDAVRAVCARSLRRLGYLVQESSNAAEALDHLSQGATVDLLVTDIVMPGMSGRELLARVRTDGHAFPVLLMSGYTPDAAALTDLPPASDFIHKPFSLDVLAAKVTAALAAAGHSTIDSAA